MAYCTNPVILEANYQKASVRKGLQVNSSSTKPSIEKKLRVEKLTVASIRVKKFLDEHKDLSFTNKEIARALNLSIHTVSSITSRLELINEIKISKVVQNNAYSMKWQSKLSDVNPVQREISNNKMSSIQGLEKLFSNSPQQIFSVELLKQLGYKESDTRINLQILLYIGRIKIVGTGKNGNKYQFCSGEQKGYEVISSLNDSYSTVSDYITKNNLNNSKEQFVTLLKTTESPKVFPSSTGAILVYPVDSLKSVHKKLTEKERNLFERIFNR